ncbi:MAG: hypothetical protein ACE5KE_00390 [Methanosarcinales archaeon]
MLEEYDKKGFIEKIANDLMECKNSVEMIGVLESHKFNMMLSLSVEELVKLIEFYKKGD